LVTFFGTKFEECGWLLTAKVKRGDGLVVRVPFMDSCCMVRDMYLRKCNQEQRTKLQRTYKIMCWNTAYRIIYCNTVQIGLLPYWNF